MARFGEATALTKADGKYSGAIAPGWDVVGNANGGYLMAILARAALLESGRPDVISVSAHFLSPGKVGPVAVAADTIKSGRRFETTRVELTSDDRTLLSGTVITGDLDDGEGPELTFGVPPDLPPPAKCTLTEPGEVFPPQFMGQIEQRIHPDDAITTDTGARIRGWFRLLDSEPLDTLAAVLASDSFPPTVFNTGLTIGWVPTIQMTVHIRNRPTTPWLMLDTSTRFVQNGMFESDATIFDENGQVVAHSRQLQLLSQL